MLTASPIYQIIVQHPIASVLTVAFCIVMLALAVAFIVGVLRS